MTRFLLGVALVPVAALALWAQTFTANLTGVVTDTQGGVISGAEVVLTSTATGQARTAMTGNDGRYTFSQLNPTTYNLSVKLVGFKEYNQTGILLSTNQSVELNIKLEVGNLAETIEITAETPLLDTRTANQSVTLESRAIQDLPVNARNPFVLAHATAGVVAVRTGVSTATQDQNHNRIAMNGGRDETVLVLIDGVPASAGDWGGLIATPGVDSVNEAQIVRNTYEAQFGKTGGGVINLTSKGGSQDYHGTLFEYHRNDNLDANSWFNNKFNRPKPEFKRNQYGGNFGGPIWKSKRIYGFFGYEGLRQGTPSSRIATVPTELQRQGDFSQTFNADGSLAVIYDPLTTRADPANPGRFLRDPFPGNRIPSNRFDPVGVNALKLFPLPNVAGTGAAQINNYFKTGTEAVTNDRYDARVDWTPGSRHTVFWRLTKSPQEGIRPELFERDAETSWDDYNPRWHTSLGNTFTLSPKTIVNVLLGGGQWTEKQISKGLGYDFTALGLSPSLASQFSVATPFVWNFGGDYSALGNSRLLIFARNIINAQVNVSREFSAHSLKFGWSVEYSQLNDIDFNSGTFNFDRFFTSGPDPDSRIARAGNSIASLLVGAGSGGSAPVPIAPAATQTYWGLYIQDAWKLTPNLTVNYGLRYELQPGRTERFDRFNYFDPAAPNPLGPKVGLQDLRGGLVFVDENDRSQWLASRHDFAPRIGIAYKVNDRLALRTGYGAFFLTAVNVGPTVGTDGFSTTTPWLSTLDSGRTPNNVLRDPYPSGLSQPTGSSAGLETNAGLAINAFLRDRPTAYMQQYSLDLQYEISKSIVLEVGYVGNQGRRLALGYGVNINEIPTSALALRDGLREQVTNPFFGFITSGSLAARTVERRQLLRPYPQFGNVTINDFPGGSSSYNALVAKVNKRFSEGLSLIGTYQWSKAIDNASENQGWEISDGYRSYNNLSLERSISGHDIPQSVALAWIYELPVGRGNKVASGLHPVVNGILGGWQVSGIYRWTSGLPLRFSAPDNVFAFGGGQYPDVTDLKGARLEEKTIDRWFNTAVFAQPATYTLGNAPRWFSNIRYDHTDNWDIALAKNWQVLESVRIQFRAEMFNAFNRVQFGRANTTFGAAAFGTVAGTAPGAGPRNIQFGLRVTF
jgi:Carboxypeptidase regulatory-like domain/TonB dependent receptor-like, beta-barrel